MLKTFPIEFVRQTFEQLLLQEHIKNVDFFGGDNQVKITSFYEQLKNQEEVDRFVETYRELTNQQNRTNLILNGVIVAPENPTITNLYSSLIVPMSWTCSMRCKLANRDQSIITINNLIEKLKGRKVDIAQLDCVDQNGKHFPQPFMVGTIGQYDKAPTLKHGDYIGNITTTNDILTILNNLKTTKGVVIPSVETDPLYLYVSQSNELKVAKYFTDLIALQETTTATVTSNLPTINVSATFNGEVLQDNIYQPILSDFVISTIGGQTIYEDLEGAITNYTVSSGTTTIDMTFTLPETPQGTVIFVRERNLRVYRKQISATLVEDDGTIDEIQFPPEHTSFEKYKVSFSFDALRCDEPYNLNENEYCELSFGGSATLVTNGIKLGNDLLKVQLSKYKLYASGATTTYPQVSPYIYYLEPLEMPSGNSANTQINQLVSNNFQSNSHTDAISLTLQYTFILDENIPWLEQLYNYARYGTQGTDVNSISPNMIYKIVEYWCSWGQFNVKNVIAKIVENIDIENTESDTLTITTTMQLQGENI